MQEEQEEVAMHKRLQTGPHFSPWLANHAKQMVCVLVCVAWLRGCEVPLFVADGATCLAGSVLATHYVDGVPGCAHLGML